MLEHLARLDEAIRNAADALGASRLRKHHALADRLREDRRILDLLSGDYLLSEIPDVARKWHPTWDTALVVRATPKRQRRGRKRTALSQDPSRAPTSQWRDGAGRA